jgi:alkylation response protein AidB-like acyl-CoA dehydrogenase
MMRFDLSPEQRALKDTARRFAAEGISPVAARFDEEQTFPADIARKAWELGLRGDEPGATHRHCTEPAQGMT